MAEMNYEEVLSNESIPANIRYAILRDEICVKAKSPNDAKELLIQVGLHLKGTLVKGHPNYWVFADGRKARFRAHKTDKTITQLGERLLAALEASK